MKYVTLLLIIFISNTSLAKRSANVCQFGSGFKQFSEVSSIVTHDVDDQIEYTVTIPKVHRDIFQFEHFSIHVGIGDNYRKMDVNVNSNYAKIVETTFYVEKKEVVTLGIRASYVNLRELEAEKNGYMISDTNVCRVTLKSSGEAAARL